MLKNLMSKYKIGVIGGTGLYGIEGFTDQKWVKIKTPFGKPSDDFLVGKLNGREVVFLARHGRGHKILPSELNHRANIWAMKKLGVQWIISVSAVGSLQEKYKPCDIVLIDQFIDRTKQSANHTFFGRGIVAHVSFAHPICDEFRQIILKTARAERATAREAEIAYATMAMATDYDCWKKDEHVTLEMILQNLHRNADMAKKIVTKVIPQIPAEPNWPCHSALKNAIMTDKKFWPKKTVAELKPILQKYI